MGFASSKTVLVLSLGPLIVSFCIKYGIILSNVFIAKNINFFIYPGCVLFTTKLFSVPSARSPFEIESTSRVGELLGRAGRFKLIIRLDLNAKRSIPLNHPPLTGGAHSSVLSSQLSCALMYEVYRRNPFLCEVLTDSIVKTHSRMTHLLRKTFLSFRPAGQG